MAIDPALSAASRVLARLNIASELLALDIAHVFALCGLAGKGLARWARVTLDHNFRDLEVTCALPPGADRAAIISELTRRDSMFGKRCEQWLAARPEARFTVSFRAQQDKVGFALGCLGGSSVEADLRDLGEFAHAGDAATELAALLGHDYVDAAMGRSEGVIDHFATPAYHSWSFRGSLPSDIDEKLVLEPIVEKLGMPAAQKGLLGRMHSVLRKGGKTEFALRIGPGVVFPELRLQYRDVSVDSLIRMLVGLNLNKEPGPPLGQFLGAMEAGDAVGWLELTLTPKTPAMRFGALFADGDPVK